MTRTRADTVKVYAYTALGFWYRLGWFGQIMLGALLLCTLELLAAWVAYPYLLERVSRVTG